MLEARNITKEFPGVKALDNVSVCFEKGEVHALMGENGAGKSTLMKIITGIYRPDAGAVYIDGQKVALKNYADSVNYDISMVHQEIQVIPESTVAENIVLDKLAKFRGRLGTLDWKRMNQTAQTYLDMVRST
jgi:ribose transport system ATP-binding protein